MLRSIGRVGLGALAVTALLSFGRVAVAGDTTEGGFAYRFAKGDKFRSGLAWDMNQKMNIMGMPIDRTVKLKFGLDQEVLEVDGSGVAKIKATLESLQLNSGPMGPMPGAEYDSTKHGGQLKFLGHLIGKSFTYKLGKDGVVSNVEGVQAMADDVESRMRDRAQKDPMAGMTTGMSVMMVAQFLSDEGMQQTLASHLSVLPKPGTKAGEAWERESNQQIGGGGVEAKVRFELKGPGEALGEKGEKIVGLATTLKLKVDGAAKGMGGGGLGGGMGGRGPKPKVKDSSMSQTAIFAKDQGRLLASEVTQKVTLDIGGMGAGPGGGRKGGQGDEDEEEGDKKKTEEKKKGDEGGEGDVQSQAQVKVVAKWETLRGEPPAKPDLSADKDEKKKGGDEEEEEETPKKKSGGEKKEEKKTDEKDKPLF